MPDDEQVPERFQALLAQIVERVVVGDYAGLARSAAADRSRRAAGSSGQ